MAIATIKEKAEWLKKDFPTVFVRLCEAKNFIQKYELNKLCYTAIKEYAENWIAKNGSIELEEIEF